MTHENAMGKFMSYENITISKKQHFILVNNQPSGTHHAAFKYCSLA